MTNLPYKFFKTIIKFLNQITTLIQIQNNIQAKRKLGGNLINSQQKLMLLDTQLKNAFKAVKQDISQLDVKLDHVKDEEIEKLKEENKVLEATLRKVLDLEHEYKAMQKFRETTKKDHDKLKEELENLKTSVKEQYPKKQFLELVKDKTEAELKTVKENLKEIAKKVKNESATKKDIEGLKSELEEYTLKVKNNFIKAANKFKEVERNTVEFDEVKAAFLTKETIEKQLEDLAENVKVDREKEISNVKKQIEKAASDFHNKVNGMQKELEEVHDKVTTLSKRAEALVHKEELAKASENFIEIDEFNKILDNIETLKREVYEKPEETATKEKDELFRKQMEKTANDIHDKVNNLRKELDSVNEKVTKTQEKVQKAIDQEELLKMSKEFVNIEQHNKVHEKIDEVKEMFNTVQFSDTEVKKLRSNVDKIILALVPKKEHDKSIENIHKKLQSLKEDIDEIDKKIK